MNNNDIVDFDKKHIWHPYSAMNSSYPVYPVKSANGVRIELTDGRELIDGMASWWCVIHGYNHPKINEAVQDQLQLMSHVMFGGFTHEPAVKLSRQLIAITPAPLQAVFFCDSGSVSVEVAMKMAIQYWHAKGQPQRQRFIALRGGYHGDTIGAMSVCDPVTGMHTLFSKFLPQQIFINKPVARFGENCPKQELADLNTLLKSHAEEAAAVVLEPIVQGAGGMWFYSEEFLSEIRRLCDRYNILLIADEIATGFGRTGRLFACEHAGITPDIMCVGKGLTGGYLSLAATLTNETIANTIDSGEPGVFMHGPTFMANPLACRAAHSSIELLLESDWQNNIKRIEQGLLNGLSPCRQLPQVADVRVLGAIGVVEMKQAVDMNKLIPAFVNAGVWVRPFGKLVYLMPPYIIDNKDLDTLTSAVRSVLKYSTD